jgi:hypothetical protein
MQNQACATVQWHTGRGVRDTVTPLQNHLFNNELHPNAESPASYAAILASYVVLEIVAKEMELLMTGK